MAQRLYLLDTNVLLHSPQSIFTFEDALVGIPAIALEQLDSFKREATDRGRNAREVIRLLDRLREKGSLGQGVSLDSGGSLRIIFLKSGALPHMPFKMRIEDNEILLIALTLKQEGYDVQFISKDLNARVKADALGIRSEDYLKEYVTKDDFYKGWHRVAVPAVQLTKKVPEAITELIAEKKLIPNEFVLVESQHNPHNYRIFRYIGGSEVVPVEQPHFQWPLSPKNPQQLMALDLLLDPEIQLITLFGPAGTGKTFLVLLAGLHEVLVNRNFEKLLVARPIVPVGKDIGYLPGTLQEKLYSWMLPIYDNMELIVHHSGVKNQIGVGNDESGYKDYHRGRKKGYRQAKGHDRHGKVGLQPLDDLIEQGKISLEAITYMRGRSIPYQFILIDEVQNLTPHEVKTLISRVGEGSKIILAGDPYQIDAPYLDFSSNGLVIINEKFKGQQLFGSVYLEKSERSELSQLVTDLL